MARAGSTPLLGGARGSGLELVLSALYFESDPPQPVSGGPYAIGEAQAQGGSYTATFDASGSTDDLGIWTYEWDFGDGNTGAGETTTHVYAAPGSYTVTLTVTDHGRQQSTTTTVIASRLPQRRILSTAPGYWRSRSSPRSVP